MLISDLLQDDSYPDELLNLYNPAYVAAALYLSGRAYQAKAKAAMPVFFPFVAFPLVCVDVCRRRLPAKVGKITTWAQQNADVLFDFPERVIALKPFVSSGLVFLKSNGLVRAEPDHSGLKFAAKQTLIESLESMILSSEDVRDELDKAPVAGRLLASNPDASVVLTVFGVRP